MLGARSSREKMEGAVLKRSELERRRRALERGLKFSETLNEAEVLIGMADNNSGNNLCYFSLCSRGCFSICTCSLLSRIFLFHNYFTQNVFGYSHYIPTLYPYTIDELAPFLSPVKNMRAASSTRFKEEEEEESDIDASDEEVNDLKLKKRQGV